MKSVSAKNLDGDARSRWVKNRREVYRSVLRDPRSTDAQKATAKEKLKTATPRK
jgi:hypothetical protein